MTHDPFSIGEAVALTKNRDDSAPDKFILPADGWYQIGKAGTVSKSLYMPGKKEPVTIKQVLTAADLVAIANRYKKDGSPELLVDFDHFSADLEKPTRAAGWIHNVEARGDELWAQMRHSSSGRNALEGGDYRYFSPVLGFPAKNYRPGDEAHPVALLCGALTNQPTFKGMVPLSNRQGDPLAQTEINADMDYKLLLIALLGLAATATDAEIQAAADAAKLKIADSAKLAETQNRLDKVLAEQVERDLDAHKLTGAARDQWKVALTKNRDEALGLLKTLKPSGKADDPTYARTHNRDKADVPNGQDIASDRGRERDSAVHEYQTRNRCSFGVAWNAVRQSKPQLFVDADQ
ncbi:MAG: phage protease [Puniceicoccales bacterium]|jgi:phage I-like protein|nr:phage protease [Puniceicoccales bacterium]